MGINECKYCGRIALYRGQCGRCGFIIVRLKEYAKSQSEIIAKEFMEFLKKAGMRNLPDEDLLKKIIDDIRPEIRLSAEMHEDKRIKGKMAGIECREESSKYYGLV